MPHKLYYGATAKVFHWAIVVLLVAQFPLGWLMPDIRRNMSPGWQMNLHIFVGTIVLILIVLRLLWRATHPVAPESSLAPWQRLSSEVLHWLLYLAVLAVTLTGWTYASMRGWHIVFFGGFELPHLVAPGSPFGRVVGQWHEPLTFALLALIALHVVAALVHLFVYKDGVMARMLPGRR